MSGITSSDEELSRLFKNVAELSTIKHRNKSNNIEQRQWLMSFFFFLPLIVIGLSHGHSSLLMQELKPATSDVTYITKIENGDIFGKPKIIIESIDVRSWIISLMILCMCPGCWLLTLCGQVLGRKKVLMISIGLFTISWMIITFSCFTIHILIGRALMGFSAGILAGSVAVYQGECAIPKLRAVLNAIHTAFLSVGIGLMHMLGLWFHWRTTAFISGLISAIVFILMFFMKESPIWLLKKKKFPQAVDSWIFWRGAKDFDELKSMHGENLLLTSQEICDANKIKTNRFFESSFLKPLGILVIFFTVAQLSGMGAVTHYCIQMIIDIAGPERAYIPTIILDVFRLLSSIISSLLTKRYSARVLALCSASGTSFFLLFLSLVIFFNLGCHWFVLILLFSYEAFVVMGLMSLPWVFCSELFPTSHKEIGISITTSYNYIFYFIVLKINPYLMAVLQSWGTFLIYGFFTFLGSIVLYFILPNTRNKSLKEIELMFNKR